ncbi:hypothetical protein LTR91_017673 [Friedmanniomyces endolithicus]|uniref:Uncharacterized protein n=2 Tax=Dothideomycetidae TaxID=451867 RepID=A0AAN6QJA6_9PEZI|nr:hypothetical protein LTS09_008879 [Friedmanniomyces endolithicus]KAK5143437.1 hypothetical protein LTR32_004434 [Rachicladosporium monterosium]KAK0362931.1 hypothetical protein LTR94_017440 [Friedmanniomyces endolithicus]KAK0783670.1 hypothetical protein LTR59_011687 [Friedmanniomyces endolithicus]KAK0793242.1 hypothetical protein LTR38_009594 [Friedmanniomyces endolithicus]
MATSIAFSPSTAFRCARLITRTTPPRRWRALSTLPNNPHIYIHESQPSGTFLLSLLPTTPPIPSLALGTTTKIPPTPDSLTENPTFLPLLHHVIAKHAHNDPDVQAQAAMYASQAGSSLGSGGYAFPNQRRIRDKTRKTYSGGGGAGGGGAGGASAQGGMGGAGRGGYIHVSDQRNPPDFGRVAWPEDILGSLELDGEGKFVEGTGKYQDAGTYRMVTNEGILGLSAYLREKVVERLKELDGQARRNA